MALVIQGLATEYNKIFRHCGAFMRLDRSCFDASLKSSDTNVYFIINHDMKQSLGHQGNLLEVYAGRDHLAFRYLLPEAGTKLFDDLSDDFDSYLGVSLGTSITKTESVEVAGHIVTTVMEAKLNEISMLSGIPAVDSTYGRVVSLDTCDTLENDYLSGKLALHGRYIGLHRKVRAQDSGNEVIYSHSTSPYDRTAERFRQALSRL